MVHVSAPMTTIGARVDRQRYRLCTSYGMDDERSTDRLGGLEGADAAALGAEPPPESAPEAAQVDDEENLVPGATFGLHPATADKPWFTSLAAESDQAGVANEPPDAQEPEFPHQDDEAL
jgi:hypothetical protein